MVSGAWAYNLHGWLMNQAASGVVRGGLDRMVSMLGLAATGYIAEAFLAYCTTRVVSHTPREENE